ncbi:MAG: TIGR00730 family Rossman fold protein [Desulfosudaceae bacterium]
MKRVCVFCGSGTGRLPDYAAAAVELGHFLAENRIGLVYGGASIGIMGQVANAALDRGGEVIGVVPEFLAVKEVAYTALEDLRIVPGMHERKALMSELSDGFMALPGGLGTIEEFVEVLTWLQLGLHRKPCGLLNVSGYFDAFIEFLNHVTDQQFLEQADRDMVLVEPRPEHLIRSMLDFTAEESSSKIAWAVKMNQSKAESL